MFWAVINSVCGSLEFGRSEDTEKIRSEITALPLVLYVGVTGHFSRSKGETFRYKIKNVKTQWRIIFFSLKEC